MLLTFLQTQVSQTLGMGSQKGEECFGPLMSPHLLFSFSAGGK